MRTGLPDAVTDREEQGTLSARTEGERSTAAEVGSGAFDGGDGLPSRNRTAKSSSEPP